MSGRTQTAREAGLADRIVVCIREADAAGLPLVAARLDAALVELRGEGVWPEGEPPLEVRPAVRDG